MEQTVTLVKVGDESKSSANLGLLNSVLLVDTERENVASVKLGPVPTFWEVGFSTEYYPDGISAIKRTLANELEKSEFVIYGDIWRGGGCNWIVCNWIVMHKSKRQMSLFTLKHSEIFIEVDDFYFNTKGNARINVFN
jgi:hypothetical protein